MAKILFIEDETRFVETYDFLFSKEGHTLIWAGNGEDGLRKAEEENPDIILLDMMMPIMSGLDFLKQYDPKNRHPNVKVVAFSNMQTDTFMHQAMELGATRYEVKSMFSPKMLVALVDELVGKTASN
jgi:DNA-binding response OmpR family regulator